MISPAKYVGDYLTVTGPDKNQCTAVCHAFQRDNGLPIVYGNAKDTYANAANAGYQTIIYRPGVVPPVGSCVVWNGTWGEGAGHTAWVESADAMGFVAISQNDPTGSKVQRRPYKYSNALIGFYYWPNLNQGVSDMVPNQKYLQQQFQSTLNREPTDAEVFEWVGKKTCEELSDVLTSQPEYKKLLDDRTVGIVAVRDKWEQQIYDLQAENATLKKGGQELKPGRYWVA